MVGIKYFIAFTDILTGTPSWWLLVKTGATQGKKAWKHVGLKST